MRTYKCRTCAFSFTEADKSWDTAIESGRCPKCSETLLDFPVPVKGQRAKPAATLPSTSSHSTTPSAQPGVASARFCSSCGAPTQTNANFCSNCGFAHDQQASRKEPPLISMYPRSTIMTVLTKYVRIIYFLLVGFLFALLCMLISPVLGITAGENLAPAGVALWIGWSLNDKTRRLYLSKTSYITLCVVYLIAATTLRTILMPSYAINERGGYYFLLLIPIAYLFSWVAIKTNKQKPIAGGE